MTHSSDVFLSYNHKDQAAVNEIANALKSRGILVWLATWSMRPGRRWQKELEQALQQAKAVAVFIGADGLGQWEEVEMEIMRSRAVADNKIPLIPVLLPGADESAELPPLLQLYHRVDLRQGVDRHGVDLLVWGINGEVPEQFPTQGKIQSSKDQQKPIDGSVNSRGMVFNLSIALGVVGILVALATWWWPRPAELPVFNNDEVVTQNRGDLHSNLDAPTIENDPVKAFPELYSIRVQTLDAQGAPISVENIKVSAGNEPQHLPDGWWEVEVPAAKLPSDRTITLWAQSPSWTAVGQQITLDDNPNPSVTLKLSPQQNNVQGRVTQIGEGPVADARITLADYPVTPVTTDRHGAFAFNIEAAKGTSYRLSVERKSHLATHHYCYVGTFCAIDLKH